MDIVFIDRLRVNKIKSLSYSTVEWHYRAMKKIWINKAGSFNEAQNFDAVYYSSLSAAERLETVQILREEYFNSKGLKFREDRKRLRRVFRVINRAYLCYLFFV